MENHMIIVSQPDTLWTHPSGYVYEVPDDQVLVETINNDGTKMYDLWDIAELWHENILKLDENGEAVVPYEIDLH